MVTPLSGAYNGGLGICISIPPLGIINMKMRLFAALLVGVCASCVGSTLSAAELTLAQDQSKISFVGSKPDGKHEGGFKKFEVTAIADFEEPGRSSINIQIDTTSLWSDNEKLTNHLKSPDFFNVRKFPSITFESTEIVPDKGEDKHNATIKGDLYMLGKKVAVDVPIESTVTEEYVEMTAKFKIDRTKWGMDYGQGKVDNDVKINVEFVLKR